MSDRHAGPGSRWHHSGASERPAGWLPFRPAASAVVRQGLLDRLEEVKEARIVVVTGVAGSGKSTLVWQWAEQLGAERSVCWVTLDARDNSLGRLCRHLHASLKAAVPDLSWQPDGPDGAELEALVTELNERFPSVAIILDDLHFLVDEDALAAVSVLVGGLGPASRLGLISRTRPSLRLARAVAAGEVVQIRGDALFFTEAETQSAMQVISAGRQEHLAGAVAAVHEFTGGWPVAVGLAARLSWPADSLVRRAFDSAHADLADYLTEEVFQTQSSEVQRFLLDTVVLDTITVDSANALRERSDGARWLDRLERDHLFLTRDGGGSQARWRLHAIVRDYLLERLERDDPERWEDLHLHASQYFVATDLHRAVTHALMAAAYDMAADLLESRIEYLAAPHYVDGPSLSRWLDAMPDAVLAQHPTLCARALGRAWSYHRHDLFARWKRIQPALPADSPEGCLAEAEAGDVAGDAERMRAAALAGLELCEPESTWVFDFHGYLCHAEELLGHWLEAAASLRWLERTLSHTPPAGRPTQEMVRAKVVVDLARAGDRPGYRSAMVALDSWLAEAADLGYTSVGPAQWAAAMIAYYEGDFAAAGSQWTLVPTMEWSHGQPLMDVIYWLDLARVRRAAGHFEEARQLLERLERTLGQFASPGRMLEWTLEEAAELAAAAGAPTAIRGQHLPGPRQPAAGAAATAPLVEPLSHREVQIVRLLRSEFSAPEIAAHLCVSYNTVKTHTRTIYRKLNASSRSQAVAQAVDLGYL